MPRSLNLACVRYKDGGESYHEGDSPDARMTAAASNRGVKLTGGSRPLKPSDLEDFDLIVGMVSEPIFFEYDVCGIRDGRTDLRYLGERRS